MKSTLFASTLASSLTATTFGQVPEIILEPIQVNEIEGSQWTTYHLYAEVPPNFAVMAVFGSKSSPLVIDTDGEFYQSVFGGPTSVEINSSLFPLIPELRWDSFVTIGSLSSNGFPFSQNVLYVAGISFDSFDPSGQGLYADQGVWYSTPDSEQGLPLDGRVLLAQLTVPIGSSITGSLNLQAFDLLPPYGYVNFTGLSIVNCGDANDTDGDGVDDCDDGCPDDPFKSAPGDCGCGVEDLDSDKDGVADCNDGCPTDPTKTSPGDCGCNASDADGDGVDDCVDNCPDDPNKTDPGTCGCGNEDTDTDGDGTADCVDNCPDDPDKTEPSFCGCGTVDTNVNGDVDCDGDYDIDDIRLGMANFGIEEAEEDTCPADVDGDGSIGFSDVLNILNDWGACP